MAISQEGERIVAYARLGLSPFTLALPALRAIGTAGIGAGATLFGASYLTDSLKGKRTPTVTESITSSITTPLILLGVGALLYMFIMSKRQKKGKEED